MGARWVSIPTVSGFLSLVAGVLFILAPNWERAQREYRTAMEIHVWSQGTPGPIEAGIGTVIALSRTAFFTFAAGVVEHPVLTILFGVGFIVAGIWLLVEYGLLAEDVKPWRDEFEM